MAISNSQSAVDTPIIFSEDLEGFLSLATHQLRSPLTTMSWTLDLLLKNLDTEPPDKVRHKLEIISHNTQTMISLVNDMLAATRINHNAMIEDRQPYLIPELLQTIIDELQPIAEYKKLSVKLNVTSPQLLTTQYDIDHIWFHLCFQNVIGNALKYSSDGGSVQITTYLQDGWLFIETTDTGIGIPEADVSHVFEKFYRGQNVHNDDNPGSGLGLFIVQSIVKQWKGEIQIQSHEHQGTTVTISFPITVIT